MPQLVADLFSASSPEAVGTGGTWRFQSRSASHPRARGRHKVGKFSGLRSALAPARAWETPVLPQLVARLVPLARARVGDTNGVVNFTTLWASHPPTSMKAGAHHAPALTLALPDSAARPIRRQPPRPVAVIGHSRLARPFAVAAKPARWPALFCPIHHVHCLCDFTRRQAGFPGPCQRLDVARHRSSPAAGVIRL